MKNILFVWFIILNFNVFTQKNEDTYFLKSFKVGSSLTYIWDDGNYSVPGLYRYNEYTYNFNVETSLDKKTRIGFQLLSIYANTFKGGLTTKNNFLFYGMLLKRVLITKRIYNFYIETSVNRSNMASDFIKEEPYTRDNTYHLGLGGSVDFYLLRKKYHTLSLELGFYNYIILNKIVAKTNFTQYIVGLNYRFGKI
ncbi:MAG TPA: hypothetical protein EYG85_10875 [Crocinitomix sp.]|nr:hypothetical protein [Crocinitomix sp.]